MLNRLVELTSANRTTTFFIESTAVEEQSELRKAGSVEKEFDKLLKRVQPFCESIIQNFKELSTRPDSASAEFGLNISAEGSLFIVKASGEATIKITLNWENMKQNV